MYLLEPESDPEAEPEQPQIHKIGKLEVYIYLDVLQQILWLIVQKM